MPLTPPPAFPAPIRGRRSPRLVRFLLALGCACALQASAPPAFQRGHTLDPRIRFTDPLGVTHTRATHRFHGIRVWGSEAILHVDAGGRRLPDAAPAADLWLEVEDASGGSMLRPVPIHLDLEPRVSLEEAHRLIRADLGPAGEGASFHGFEKVIYPVHRLIPPDLAPGREPDAGEVATAVDGHLLAWLIRVRAGDGPAWDYLVEARHGRVLKRLPVDLCASMPSVGEGRTCHSGQVALDTTLVEAGDVRFYTLVDRTRAKGGEFNGNAVTRWDPGWGRHGLPFSSDRDVWGDFAAELGGARPAMGATTNAADAAFSLQRGWDYLKQIHHWVGWDGKGTPVVVQVATGAPGEKTPVRDNAAWLRDCKGIGIFPGTTHLPLTDVASVTHELAHGVNQATCDMAGEGEAGGLNEAFSDIIGLLAKTYLLRHQCLGDEIGTPAVWNFCKFRADGSGAAEEIRNFKHPSVDGHSPDTWTRGLAELDPHHACGPMLRAFYFLAMGSAGNLEEGEAANLAPLLPAAMAGLGTDRAAAILFRAYTVYLKPRSTYLDALRAFSRAAADLYGPGSPELEAVAKAFQAIAVNEPAALAASARTQVQAELAGGVLTLAASGTGIRSAVYCIDSQVVDTVLRAPFRLQLDPGRLRNGYHLWSAYVHHTDGQVRTFKGLFTVSNPVQQLLLDPAFEQGFWTASGTTWAEVSRRVDDPVALVLGTPYARFQGDPMTHPVRALSQRVQVPFALAEARLAFRAHITASRTEPARDRLTLQVLEPTLGATPARVLAAGLTLTGADAWEDWVEYSIPLPALAWLNDPKEVEVRLEYRPAHADAVFRIQDLRLLASDQPQARVVPSPARVLLAPGGQASFTARIAGALDQRVTWKLREPGGGTLTSQGGYTAPDRPGWYHAVAASAADPRIEAEVSIQVRAREAAAAKVP